MLLLCSLGAGPGVAAILDANALDTTGMQEEEIGAGQLRLAGPFGYQPAIQLSAKAHFRVTGLVAQVTVEQSFHNNTGEWVEGEYLFPLPDRAAVNRLKLVIGERVIIGEIKEKEAARATYEQAKASGRKASLVEQRRPNLFSNRVANIAPGEVVTVELSYVQRVDYRDGQFSLRFPMTVTPRYSPAGHPGAAEVWQFQNPTPATAANPIHPIELTAEINIGLPLEEVGSPYHSLSMTREREIYQLALAQGQTPMDRDFLLSWRPRAGSEPQAAVFHERIGTEEYALLMVLPPQAPAAQQLPRELVFVIDTSGSMGGSSIQQARASLAFGLTLLRPGDRFNIVEFNSGARILFPDAVDASPHNLARASEFVRHLDAGGGTEMRGALELALPLPAPEGDGLLRQVVFITDGAVGNEVELFREIRRRLGASRLFTVGIGSAPNGWFMRKAAQAGRGEYVFIGDVLEVRQGMQTLFERLSQTLIADIRVDWPAAVETYPQSVPDLYPGEPLVITARSRESLAGGSVTVSGLGAGEGWQKTLDVRLAPAGMEQAYTGIGTVWARAAIESLLDEKALGRAEEEVRAAILPLALEHQLVSPYTSFVAVEQQPSRPPDAALAKKPVPNLRPHGQSAQPFAWPGTATTFRLNIYLGLLALLMACVFWRSPAWAWR
jgi:Ca-activated chloride channel family protein